MDLANIVGGSGIIKYRGMTRESKDGINVTFELETEEIVVDGLSKVDERVNVIGATITLTDSGKWTNPDRLFPYLNWPLGRLVLPVLPISINTGTDVITATNHRFVDGDRVYLGCRPEGTLPQVASADIDRDTAYFVHVATDDTFTVHATRANALANTSPINFTGAGTDAVVVGQFDLELIGEDGVRHTFWAVAISEQPDMNLTRKETPFGSMTLRAFTRHRMLPSDDNSLVTKDSPGFPGWGVTASEILTQSPYLTWADILEVESVSTVDDQLDITSHGLADGDGVYLVTTGTLPAAAPALDPERKYFVNAATVDAVTLHLTEAAALAGTGAIDLTAAGTGALFLAVENAPFDLMDTEAGVQVTAPCDLSDKEGDRSGIYNARLTAASMEATVIVLGLSAQSVITALKVQGSGAQLGRSLNAGSKPLCIFSPGMFVKVNGAAPKSGELAWSMENDRARDLTFVNTRTAVNGVMQPIGVVGTSFE